MDNINIQQNIKANVIFESTESYHDCKTEIEPLELYQVNDLVKIRCLVGFESNIAEIFDNNNDFCGTYHVKINFNMLITLELLELIETINKPKNVSEFRNFSIKLDNVDILEFDKIESNSKYSDNQLIEFYKKDILNDKYAFGSELFSDVEVKLSEISRDINIV